MKVNHRFVEKVDPIEEKKRLLLRKEMKEAYKKANDLLQTRNKINQVLQHLLEEPEELNQETQSEEVVSKEQPQLFCSISFNPIFSSAEKESEADTNQRKFEPFSSFQWDDRKKGIVQRILENPVYKKRIYQTAIQNYKYQMVLAQNHFHFYEPTFSKTA